MVIDWVDTIQDADHDASMSAEKVDDQRFFVPVVAIPVIATFAAGPLMGVTARLSGNETSGGAVDINPVAFAVVGPSAYVVIGLIMLAVARRLPLERRRFGPLPAAAALAVFCGGIVAGALSPDVPVLIAMVVVAPALAVGGLVGHRGALRLIGSTELPVTSVPAPAGADRYSLSESATAVWVGRVAPVSAWTWAWAGASMLPASIFLAVGGPSWLVVVLAAALIGHCFARLNRRVGVLIGPTGVQVRAGVTRRVRLRVELANIAAAMTTTLKRPGLFAGRWTTKGTRLVISTGGTEALQVVLSDGSEIALSMTDPDEPARVLNGLLDRRAVVADGPAPC